MPADRTIIICFHRNDGHRQRIPLPHGTLAEAVLGIQRVFHVSDGLYTKAEIYRGNRHIETVANTWSVRALSIMVQ
jgi:hypothetical protein